MKACRLSGTRVRLAVLALWRFTLQGLLVETQPSIYGSWCFAAPFAIVVCHESRVAVAVIGC